MEYKPVIKGGVGSPPNAFKEGLLKVRTANQSIRDAMQKAVPMQLCGNLWFEGEVSILFADTNLGKSVLAVQIGDTISRGSSGENLDCFARSQPVLYLDFEQSDKQFENRYSVNYTKHYLWDSNFFRVNINTLFTEYSNFEEQLFSEIEIILREHSAKILIVDNVTFLKMQSTEKGNEAMALMKRLIQLKQEFGLSLLVLAHTPKRQNQYMPLTLNDLAGSKQLSNFADSIFCIGSSTQGSDLRYVKQLKARSCTVAEEVAVFRLEKVHNRLMFTYQMQDFERSHLKSKAEASNDLSDSIVQLKNEHPDWSLQLIGDEVGANKMMVKRTLDKHKS